MSIPSVVHVFESGINAAPTSSLESLIRLQLEIAIRDAPTLPTALHEDRKSGTLFSDMGDYLTHAASILSHLTVNLVSGSHVEMATIDAHEQARLRNKLAHMNPLATMDVEQRKLCKIRDLTEKFSRDVQEVWCPEVPAPSPDSAAQQTAISPYMEVKRSPLTRPLGSVVELDPRVHENQKALPASHVPPSHSSPGGNVTASDDSDDEDEDEQFARIDMEALKQRGKGSYYCPLGHRCDKGGVDKDNNLILFDRNSSFAQHCNKHRKPWRCDVPGCPNPPKKRKFARRDGLERHKATVKHRVVT